MNATTRAPKPQTWVVQVHASILGPIVAQGRPAGGRFRPAAKLPAGLRQYLNLPADLAAHPVLGDFRTLEELDALAFDEHLVKRRAYRFGQSRLLTIVLPPAMAPRPRPRVPRGVPAIRTLGQLCDHFGADTPAGLNRRLYKDTACGASISLKLADGSWLHNGADGWRQLPLHARILAFTVQTIVEGSDAEVNSDAFVLPVAKAEVDAWMADMEAQADELWHEANSNDDDDNDEEPPAAGGGEESGS